MPNPDNDKCIYMTPFVRILDRLVYLAIKLSLRGLLLFGYKRYDISRCTIWAPPAQIVMIRHGLEHLRMTDEKMFCRVVTEERLIFFYQKRHYTQLRNIFTVTDNYLFWGDHGVAICFVQSLMIMEERRISSTLGEVPLIANTRAVQKTFDWIRNYRFPTDLVEQYREFCVEKGAVLDLNRT
jgi:hypothetical protein